MTFQIQVWVKGKWIAYGTELFNEFQLGSLSDSLACCVGETKRLEQDIKNIKVVTVK